MKKEGFKISNNVFKLENKKDTRKEEKMLESIHKAVAQEVSDSWRSHIPVYGWIQMNYPSSNKKSLLSKYNPSTKDIQKQNSYKIGEDSELNLKQKSIKNRILSVDSSTLEKNYLNDLSKRNFKHHDRMFPDKVNENVVKESNFL